MPRALQWLVGVLALQLVVDVAGLVWGEPADSALTTVAEVAALLIDAVVLGLIVRATELTRAVIRGAAGVGMVVDTWILVGVVMWMPDDRAGLVAVATSLGLVLASAFAWVVLGRADVKAWIFGRWIERTLGPTAAVGDASAWSVPRDAKHCPGHR